MSTATPARKGTMDKKALSALAKDAYSYGAEQGFRLGYLATGEVVAAATREHHHRAGEYLRDELRRRFDEVAARSMAEALGE